MVLDHEVSNNSKSSATTTIDDYRSRFKSPISEAIEQTLLWSQHEYGTQEIIDAKNDFYILTGKFFPEDYFYINRISYFIDYFLFQRIVKSTTPSQAYFAKHETIIQEAIHGIFLVQRVSNTTITLKSLINSEKYKISSFEGERFDGILKGDIIQGFIYKSNDLFYLSRALLFHPHKASKYIKKKIRRDSRLDNFNIHETLWELARVQIKHIRHDHVNPKVFYSVICK